MRTETCPHERELVLAVRSEAISESQQRHLESCSSCREAVMVASWAQKAARAKMQRLSLPDAQSIWWRSRVVKQLIDQDNRIERRTRPLLLVQGLATLTAVVTMLVFFLNSGVLAGLVSAVSGVGGDGGAVSGVPAALIAAALMALGAGALVTWRLSSELG